MVKIDKIEFNSCKVVMNTTIGKIHAIRNALKEYSKKSIVASDFFTELEFAMIDAEILDEKEITKK